MLLREFEFQLDVLRDPRLSVHASSPFAVWLWTTDGTALLWANPSAGPVFGEAPLPPPQRAQLVQIGGRLPPSGVPRLERLRGFGAPLGRLLTCACSRIVFDDGLQALLVVALEPTGRAVPPNERLAALVAKERGPLAAFAADGARIAVSPDGAAVLGDADSLDGLNLDGLRALALRTGQAHGHALGAEITLYRVGSGPDLGFIAEFSNIATAKMPDREAFPKPASASPPSADIEPEAATTSQATAIEKAPAEMAATHGPAEEPAEATREPTPEPMPEAAAEPAREPAPEPGPVFDGAGDLTPITEAAAEDMRATPTPAEHQPASDLSAKPDEAAAFFETQGEPPASLPPASEPIVLQRADRDEIEEPPFPRRHPLRFTWQMDSQGRFVIGADEFIRLIGPQTATAMGRPWGEINADLTLDPTGEVARAVATRDTFSGIVVQWPFDGAGERLSVELSGLPIFSRTRTFLGYRGFGVCRDFPGLDDLARLRQQASPPASASPEGERARAHETDIKAAAAKSETMNIHAPATDANPAANANVVQLRPNGDGREPALSPVENRAFSELARELSERLGSETPSASPGNSPKHDVEAELPAKSAPDADADRASARSPFGEVPVEKPLLDHLPVGVLIYRLDRLIYANRAFLDRTGHASLEALTAAGGLDALFIETAAPTPGVATDEGTALVLTTTNGARVPVRARLFTISWDGDRAMALIFDEPGEKEAATPQWADGTEAAVTPTRGGTAQSVSNDASMLRRILDAMSEGAAVTDPQGRIEFCNRTAEEMLGQRTADIAGRDLPSLLTPESARVARTYFETAGRTDIASLLGAGREVWRREPDGRITPFAMTLHTLGTGGRLLATFRDLSAIKSAESELAAARRDTEKATHARESVLARISYEIRAPLSAILGFTDVMINERFGPVGNERYVAYLKDIHESGERVIGLVNDMLDLSHVEAGKLDLAFSEINLNTLVEDSVAGMQPQANRGRIIIRTSLAHGLPLIRADLRALSQVVLNIVANSIGMTKPGGQVIVSTMLADSGDITLRVRDSGHGMSDHEIAEVLEPFTQAAPADRTGTVPAGLNLPITKALVEANGAEFHIRRGGASGTLVEVVFPAARAKAS